MDIDSDLGKYSSDQFASSVSLYFKRKIVYLFVFFFNITSLILSDQCVFLCYAPSVVKQREVGVYVVVPLFCKMVVPCSC